MVMMRILLSFFFFFSVEMQLEILLRELLSEKAPQKIKRKQWAAHWRFKGLVCQLDLETETASTQGPLSKSRWSGNPSLGQSLGVASGWARLDAAQGLANTKECHVTFFLPLGLLSGVLLQPLPLLALPPPHSPVPVQRGLPVNLALLVTVSTELGSCSGFSPDIQPAIA